MVPLSRTIALSPILHLYLLWGLSVDAFTSCQNGNVLTVSNRPVRPIHQQHNVMFDRHHHDGGVTNNEEDNEITNNENSTDEEDQQQKNHQDTDNDNDDDEEEQDRVRLEAERRDMKKRIWRNILIAEKQQEIDDILSGPDPPFDLEGELQKVTYVSNGLPPGSPEEGMDRQLAKLEDDLYVASSNNDFTKAASKSYEISRMHLEDCGAVLQVNSGFYRAFSDKSYQDMASLWLRDNSVVCIHPSHKPLVGYVNVLQSWKNLFDATVGAFQQNWMEAANLKLTVKGSLAIVTCDENVLVRRFVRGEKRKTELVNQLTATNIFRKVGGKWYMVHHHASFHPDSEAAQNALNGGKGKKKKRKKKPSSRSSAPEESLMKGILGTQRFGPVLNDGKDGNDDDDQDNKPKKQGRVIFGSISDLLGGGGLSDIMSRKDKNDFGEDEEEDDDDDDDDEQEMDLPIRISLGGFDMNDNEGFGMNSNGEGEDNNDDDDDDDDDDTPSLIKTWMFEGGDKSSNPEISGTGRKIISGSNAPTPQSSLDVATPTASNSNAGAPKDALRQNCISALRNLCNQVRHLSRMHWICVSWFNSRVVLSSFFFVL